MTDVTTCETTLRLNNWSELSDQEKEEVGVWFSSTHPHGWNWRTFEYNTQTGNHDMVVEFTDSSLALMFKLRWGGR